VLPVDSNLLKRMPKGDVWKIKDNDIKSQYYGRIFKFDFSFIDSESIKDVSKAYIWRHYRDKSSTLSTLYAQCRGFFPKVVGFLSLHRISNLANLTNNHVDLFLSYLKTLINPKNNKVYARGSQKRFLDALKNIVRFAQLYMPNEAPKKEIFTGNEFKGMNKKMKTDFIPDEVVIKLNNALLKEENPYLRHGIIILQATGMRIGDLLLLTTDCIKPHLISGYTITLFDHKNRKQRKPLPVVNECAIAVQKLIDFTKELREQADDSIKDYLFIHKVSKGNKVGELMRIREKRYNVWLNGRMANGKLKEKGFVHVHNILGADGECYNLTSHQFRRKLATDMLSKGTNINIIKEVLGHSDPSTTNRHYADIKDKERAEVWSSIGIIGNINLVNKEHISDKQELLWFKNNKNKGAKMEDGYCTKPCTDGKICDRLLKRQKCYTCNRYITTPEYLEYHRSHLAELEKQLEDNIYGEHYAGHFLPTIEILREIVIRLEGLQDANREVAATSDNC
jgi:integrase